MIIIMIFTSSILPSHSHRVWYLEHTRACDDRGGDSTPRVPGCRDGQSVEEACCDGGSGAE